MKRLQKKSCFYLFMAVLSGFCHRAFTQNLSGIVIEKTSRLPVSFVSVTYRVNGRLAGTISDAKSTLFHRKIFELRFHKRPDRLEKLNNKNQHPE